MSGVFLSYAREDLPFVRRLRDALSAAGRDPAWDQDHAVVPFSSPYQSEIDTAIAGSEKFVFVISPDSLDSGPCAAELAEAAESNKQIIPLLRRPARDGQSVAKAVAERNWIFFDDDARFEASLAELIQTLDTDLDWVKIHTRLLVRAREWTDGSDRSRLLRGRDLRDAESWLAKGDAHPQAPPTGSQRAFIAASRRTADRVAWLQRSVLAAGLVIAVVLASLALVSRNQAIHQRNAAIYNQTLAEALRFGTSDTPLAAQLNLAAYRMQPSQGLTSILLSTDNAPLSRSLAGDSGPVTSVAFSPSGQTLATGSNGTVRLWDVAGPADARPLGRPLHGGLGQVNSVAFSRDGHTLASSSFDGTVSLWNVVDPAHPVLLTQGQAGVTSVAFSPDGTMLAAGYKSGAVRLWNVTDPARSRPLSPLLTGDGTGPVDSVAFSPGGQTLASAGEYGAVQLWDIADPAHPVSLGRPLASGGAGGVFGVAFSPDRRTLASADYDGTVGIWDVADPAHPRAFGQPLLTSTNVVNSVAFSRSGQTLASSSDDKTVRLWNAADPAHPVSLGPPLTGDTAPVGTVAFSPDGDTLASGSGDGTVRLWNMNVDDAIERICTTAGDLTPQQWQTYIFQLSYQSSCTH